MPRSKALLILSLASLFAPAFGQSANPARPGTLNYIEGQASVDGRQVSHKSIGATELEPGQYLATANGKAEILLTPGVFLRLDNNSMVKMVSPNLTHTEVELVNGRVSVEADQLYPQNMVLIDQKNGQTQLLKNGLYEFNADNGTMRTFDGKAAVYPGNDMQSDVKPVNVKGGRQLTLTGEAVKPQSFDKDRSHDDLYNWSSLRSQYLGNANVDLAAQYAGAGAFNPGWYWDSAMYGYDWLPGGYDPFFSPFGFGFYSPYYLYGGGFVYGRGFYGRGYGYRGGYGFSGARGGGFRGGAVGGRAVAGGGGFHGGGGFGGGGGGFHGGGGGGGGHR
jgi:hypothetical protein